MNRILKAYLKRLTNLSTRNKSLLLAGLPAEQFLDLHETDFLLEKPSIELIKQLVSGKSRIALCDVADSRFEKVNEVSKKLRKIARTERFIEEERGSRDLYVGYPFVKGKLSDGTPIHAPLLFFPVTLKMDREQWCLFEVPESNVILNSSFLLAYAHFNEAAISDDILEKSFEDFPKDFLEFRTQLYEWLKTTPLKINFNQALFEDKGVVFNAQKSSELAANERNGELKLFPEAVLGIFPQAGSYLVPDYNLLLESAQDTSLTIPLLGEDEPEADWNGQTDVVDVPFKNKSVREEEILTPFPVDQSQEEIILAVKSGKSVVVQGPPGSGKSQLICNLMADFAARGKRVLLVCQKRVALDVVYQRLQTIGMTDFVGLIHDFKNDRPALYRQLASQIDQVEAYKQQNYSLDAVFLERQFTQQSRAIDKTVQDLNAFREALFDESECGVSIKELYLKSDQKAPKAEIKEHYRSFRMDNLDHFRRRLKTYSAYVLHFPAEHVWTKRRSFAKFGMNELRSMEKMLSEWPEVFSRQAQKFEVLTKQPFSLDYVERKSEITERLTDITELISDATTFNLFKKYIATPASAHERLAFIRQTTDALEGFLAEDGIEFSLPAGRLPGFLQILRKSIEANSATVSGLWWNMFGKEKKEVEEVAKQNDLSTSLDHLLKLEIKVKNRIELEGWLTNRNLNFEAAYIDLNETDVGAQYIAFFQKSEAAADAVARASLDPWFLTIRHIAYERIDQQTFSQSVYDLKTWIGVWSKLEAAMLPFLLPQQIRRLLEDPTLFSQQLSSSLTKDFDSMVDMDSLAENMTLPEHAVTKIIMEQSKKLELLHSEAFVNLFENSIRLAWIEHIESKYSDLRAVTSLKMKQWEDSLQESIKEKQKLSTDITGIKLREATYEDIEKNRLGNRVTYRELGHQVTKKRKIWPIRKLIENYTDEVFSLIPCWMASPEAVSAVFPMQAALFDLVIFDEASQCYAEYGLPAAFRGSQVVVTGDSKQLSPSDLYKIRYEDKAEEEEYTAALEIESLLDLAAQSLDQYQLTGHYRSLSLDLIDFSNRNFYKDTLRLLPDFRTINDEQPGIQYIKTEGVWKNNINLIEIAQVVELIKEVGETGKSIGVVTFNFYQQNAIQDALERENVFFKDLFVKNIENVQGDERDIIIFSMGYAPDEKGKVSMQFGSLNMQGGENRLNVAVTRARERIYFVTSLWPSELKTDQTANAGPKILKAYLEYALNVSEGKFVPVPFATGKFRSDWLLKDQLVKQHADFQKELPFGDITIKKEGVYKGLILTDDDLYHYSKSSKEPHAYLPLLLQQKNWPYSRIYSREYWTNSLDYERL
ncbi:AAA domain-containing protein [Dyadobacter sp. LJ53]|uniref:AAA domain-containing protein n=1 Tax=Dyadobacter chenwenxiniae TaxID=2906456 RepID=UPI001F1DDE1F|nr:AAA domain-containing protein [Dyadobacter chenwenxiniae]MCF0053966.1 AAA domain-containing protein [Dyadobacter chenwenxiniae]